MRQHYAPVAQSCPAVRKDLRAFLSAYRLDDEFVHNLVLVVNELAANAVDHARTTFSVSVVVTADTLRVEVADGSTQRPRLRPRHSSARGHGLRIVDALVTAWSVTRTAGGKTVRADLAIP